MRTQISIVILLVTLILLAVFVTVPRGREVAEDQISQEGVQENLEPIKSCTPTTTDGEGPYYLPNKPFRDIIAPPGAQGETLSMQGRVLDTNCQPIAGAILDIWHADTKGVYQNDWYRGKVKTNENGEYQFTTVVPGRYASRPIRHIHIKVSATSFQGITTQLYFDSTGPQDRVVPVQQESNTTVGVFDFVLQSN